VDNSLILTVVIGVLGLVNTWVVFMIRSFSAEVTTLRVADAALSERIASMNVLVAGQYVTRMEFRESLSAQTSQLVVAMERVEQRVAASAATVAAALAAAQRVDPYTRHPA
jgi:hexokinase